MTNMSLTMKTEEVWWSLWDHRRRAPQASDQLSYRSPLFKYDETAVIRRRNIKKSDDRIFQVLIEPTLYRTQGKGTKLISAEEDIRMGYSISSCDIHHPVQEYVQEIEERESRNDDAHVEYRIGFRWWVVVMASEWWWWWRKSTQDEST